VGRELDLAFPLEAAGTREAVTVSSSAPSLETLPAGVPSVLDERAISELPLNGRRFQRPGLLTPGASQDLRSTMATRLRRGPRVPNQFPGRRRRRQQRFLQPGALALPRALSALNSPTDPPSWSRNQTTARPATRPWYSRPPRRCRRWAARSIRRWSAMRASALVPTSAYAPRQVQLAAKLAGKMQAAGRIFLDLLQKRCNNLRGQIGTVGRCIGLAEVRVQEGESLENALRRFKRKVQQEDIIKEVKRHSFYLKPGEKRRAKEALARKRNRKKARKEQD